MRAEVGHRTAAPLGSKKVVAATDHKRVAVWLGSKMVEAGHRRVVGPVERGQGSKMVRAVHTKGLGTEPDMMMVEVSLGLKMVRVGHTKGRLMAQDMMSVAELQGSTMAVAVHRRVPVVVGSDRKMEVGWQD